MKNCPSFPSFRCQYRDENRKLSNLGNFQLPQTNKQNQLTLQDLRQDFLEICNLEIPEVFSFITVNKTEGVFEYSGNFQVCLVKAHQCINAFL